MSQQQDYKKDLQKFAEEESEYLVSLDDFDFGSVIGKGGFGEVTRGIRISTGQDCAVKQIFNARVEGPKLRRYISEVKTMASCNNLFLVPLIGFTKEPPYCIVTEYQENGSLDQYVRRRNGKTLTGTQNTAIAIGIAYAMIHLHSKGIIHRDLKSANILLDNKLYPKICDFGIARFESVGMKTQKIGTPHYMAPELITSRFYDGKVDVYAYAMILYEMSELQKPFRDYDLKEIFAAVVQDNERPDFTLQTPAYLRKLIEKCWDEDPKKRPTFEEIFEEFKTGKVYFPGTKRDEITKFLLMIQRDEEKRSGRSPILQITAPIKNKDDSYSSSYSSSDSPPPPKQRKSLIDAIRNQPSKNNDKQNIKLNNNNKEENKKQVGSFSFFNRNKNKEAEVVFQNKSQTPNKSAQNQQSKRMQQSKSQPLSSKTPQKDPPLYPRGRNQIRYADADDLIDMDDGYNKNSQNKQPQSKFIQKIANNYNKKDNVYITSDSSGTYTYSYEDVPKANKYNSDDAEVVLKNPYHRLFYRYVEYYADTITEDQFSLYYNPLMSVYKEKQETKVLKAILNGFSKLMERNHAFIPLFDKKHFFENLFTHNSSIIDENVDVLSKVFQYSPRLLGSKHLTCLNQLINSTTQKMLILYSFYVKQFNSLHNPWPLLDDFLNYVKLMNEKHLGAFYLSIFTYLLSNFPIYAKERTLHLRAVYYFFLTSKDKDSVKASYYGIAQFYPLGEGIDFIRVAHHLKDSAICESALSFLMRCSKIFPNNELFDNILTLTKTKPQAWVVLYTLANSVRGSSFLIKNSTKWMKKCSFNPTETARVFFILFKDKLNRSQVTSFPDFTLLLKTLLDTHEEKMHSYVTKCVRYSPHNPQLLDKLTNDGVIDKYIAETVRGKAEPYFKRALAFFDCLSRIAYSPAFLKFIPQLTNLLSSQTLAADAITVSVSMSNYKDCCVQFKQNGMVDYFTKLKNVDQYSKAASIFLKNVQAV